MTAITRDDYTHLRSYMVNTSNHNVNKDKIEKLKLQYELEINSVRRLEKIETVQDLIELLEKRAILSENDITALTDIANTINNKDFLQEIEQRHNRKHMPLTPELTNGNVNVTSKVYNLIINELGKSWADFARGLNICEGTLDQLKYKYRENLKGCITEVLQYHAENSHPNEWKRTLLNALTEARRNDLRKSVENIYYLYS